MADLAYVRKDWESRGFSCDIWTDPPGQVWVDYVHEVDELVMLIDGEIELSFAGQTIRPQVGEQVFIPAGVRHTVRNIGQTTNHWYYGYKYKGQTG